MSTLITKTQVVNTLRALVEQHGADTIRSNQYLNDRLGVPNCIAGCAFFSWGMSLQELAAAEGACVGELAESGSLGDLEFTEAAITVLGIAQDEQDAGHSWGNVLGAALDAAEGWGNTE
jgi:hypothetical protein